FGRIILGGRARGRLYGDRGMNQPLPLPAAGAADDELVADRIEELAGRLQAGGPVDLGAGIRERPGGAGRRRALGPDAPLLARRWPAVQLRGDVGQATAPETAGEVPPGVLGDFRILGEVGRGGMGVVYEAVQISLRRRVALKVLPRAGVLDPRHLQRFRNE